MSDTEESVDLQEMLQLQLTEVEMLQSMFGNPGEFTLDSVSALEELRAFVEGTVSYVCLQSRVGFTIKMEISASLSVTSHLELVCHLPHEYPSVFPDVFIRAPHMEHRSQRRLSEEFHRFKESMDTGQLLIGSLVSWLQENAHMYLQKEQESGGGERGSGAEKGRKEDGFTRLWIHSHHIYSKFKRKNIVDWATELELKGFSMPGKPGVICVEGYTTNVDEFWYRIRRLNWKRLTIKEQEKEELQGREITSLCRFGKFQELMLGVTEGRGRNYHMDLGKFNEFLREHDSANIFPLFFGVEGKGVGE